MAVEQSGAEAAQGETAAAVREPNTEPAPPAKPSAPSNQDAPAKPGAPGRPELDEVKRKFREALERKRGEHASANAEGAQDTGKVHGSHGPAASRRSFRRKSGS